MRFCRFCGRCSFSSCYAICWGRSIGEVVTLFNPKHPSHLGGTATGNPMTTMALAACAFFFIHGSGIVQVARSLMNGTYGHHGHHEEHSSNGNPGHEAAHDLEHVRERHWRRMCRRMWMR